MYSGLPAIHSFRVSILGLLLGLMLAQPALASDPLEGLADPTRPSHRGVVAEQNRGGLVLQSTQVSAQQQVAVISGQRLTVGSKIGGAEVVAIRPFEVILRRSGKETVLRLLPKLPVEKHKNESAPDANP